MVGFFYFLNNKDRNLNYGFERHCKLQYRTENRMQLEKDGGLKKLFFRQSNSAVFIL